MRLLRATMESQIRPDAIWLTPINLERHLLVRRRFPTMVTSIKPRLVDSQAICATGTGPVDNQFFLEPPFGV